MSKLVDALKRAEHLRKERQVQDRSAAGVSTSLSTQCDPALLALRQKLETLEALRKPGRTGDSDEPSSSDADFSAELHALETQLAELLELKQSSSLEQTRALEARRLQVASDRRSLQERIAQIESELASARAEHAAQAALLDERAKIERSSLEARLASLEEDLRKAKEKSEESRQRAANVHLVQTAELSQHANALEARVHEINRARLQVEAEIARAESDFQSRLSTAEQEVRELEQRADAALREKQAALSALESGIAARIAATEKTNQQLRVRAEQDAQAAQVARARLAAEDRLRIIEETRAHNDQTEVAPARSNGPESTTGAHTHLIDQTTLTGPSSRRVLQAILVCASMIAIGFWIADFKKRKPADSVVASVPNSSTTTPVTEINKTPPQKYEPVSLKLDRQLRRSPR